MKICVTADLHIGADSNIDAVRTEYLQCFQMMLEHNPDLIVFAGDFFDTKLYINSQYTELIFELIQYISNFGCRVRLISGTLSHDVNQYILFKPYLKSNILIINKVYEEVINGRSILYIPEEIIGDKIKYYNSTIYSKCYDYIFGHGVILEGMTMVKDTESKPGIRTIPKFRCKDFNVNYYCIFGHYHRHTIMSDKCRYVGSLSRTRFGEPEEKGWYYIEDDKIEFQKNILAPEYLLFEIPENQSLEEFENTLKNILINIDQYEESRNKYRLLLKYNRDNESISQILSKLQAVISENPQISYKIEFNDINIDKSDEIQNKYEYLFDKSLSIGEKITIFLDGEISIDEVEKLISVH